MRMRKKRHLDERLINSQPYLIDIDKTLDPREVVQITAYVDLVEVFGNDKPIILEMRCILLIQIKH